MIQEPKTFYLLNDFKEFPTLLESGKTFCVFDTETTGLKAEDEKVIEIGAVKFNKDGIIEKFETLINPEKYILPFITEINNISNEMVKDAPKSKEALEKFLDFSKDCILIAHNAQFDLSFINYELMRLNKSTLTNKSIDTLKFSKWCLPTLGTWKLQSLAKHFEINVENAHRAYDDARVCMELFLKLVDITKEKN